MNWVPLATALARLGTALFAWLRERALLKAGEARGRAASDADHARAAIDADERMKKIAASPPGRAAIAKRLEEGSA